MKTIITGTNKKDELAAVTYGGNEADLDAEGELGFENWSERTVEEIEAHARHLLQLVHEVTGAPTMGGAQGIITEVMLGATVERVEGAAEQAWLIDAHGNRVDDISQYIAWADLE